MKVIFKFAMTQCNFKDSHLESQYRTVAALLLRVRGGKENLDLAKEYYTKNIKQASKNEPELFYSLLGLAECHLPSTLNAENEKDAYEKVLQYVDKALALRSAETGPLRPSLDNGRCADAFIVKARAHHRLNCRDQAVQSYTQALQENFDSTSKNLMILSSLVDLYSEMGNDAKIFNALGSQSTALKVEWILTENKAKVLRQAGVKAGRVDFVIQLYEDAIAHCQQRVYTRLSLQLDLALIYRCDARATKMAGIILRQVEEDSENTHEHGITSRAFPHRVDIMHETCNMSNNKAIKSGVILDLENLIKKYEDTPIVDSYHLAYACLVLAKLHRHMDQNDRCKMRARQAFKLCVADLEDTVVSNDMNAFQLMSKLLMLVDLKQEAQVMASLAFSNVNVPPDEPISSQQDDHFTIETNDETSRDASPDNTSPANASIEYQGDHNAEPTEAMDPGDHIPKPSQNALDGLTPELCREEGLMREEDEYEKATEEMMDYYRNQDLAGYSYIECDGSCETPNIDNWDFQGKKWYMCLDCQEIDFCEDCYRKQMEFYKGEGQGFLFKRCWAGHNYLERPIDNWLGVKNGFIRIGGRKREWNKWFEGIKDQWERKIDCI